MLCIYGASSRFRTADPLDVNQMLYPWAKDAYLVDAAGVEPAVLCSGGFTVHWGYQFSYTSKCLFMAEAVGFEPTEPCGSLVFKTSALSRTRPHFLKFDCPLADTEWKLCVRPLQLLSTGKRPLSQASTEDFVIGFIDSKQKTVTDKQRHSFAILVAEGGFEPPTSWLWAKWANRTATTLR